MCSPICERGAGHFRQVKVFKAGKYSSAVCQVESGIRPEYELRQTSTTQEPDREGKIPAATDTDKTNITVEVLGHYAR